MRAYRSRAAGVRVMKAAAANAAFLQSLGSVFTQAQLYAYHFGMRRILIEHARARNAQKRDGATTRIPFDDTLSLTREQSAELMDLDQALTELEQRSPRQARVVELRYFSGLNVPEIASALGVNPRSVDRDWAAARAWLRSRLRG